MPVKTRCLTVIIAVLWLNWGAAGAQEALDRNGKGVSFSLFKTKDTSLTIESIISGNYYFKDGNEFTERSMPSDIFWIKLDFGDEFARLDTEEKWFLRTPGFEYASLYFQENDIIKEMKFGRFLNENPEKRSIMYLAGIPFESNSLIDGRYLFLKVRRVVLLDRIDKWKIAYGSTLQNDIIKGFYSSRDMDVMIPIFVFSGICLVMFIFTLGFYFYTKRQEFLFYAGYVLFLFLYLTGDLFRLPQLIFGEFNLISYTFFQVNQVTINLAYILFVIYYLETKDFYPRLHVALKWIAYVLTLVIVLDIAFLLAEYFIGHIYLLDLERVIMTVFGLVGMTYLLFKRKDKLAVFIVTGSFCYMLGALGLLFLRHRLYMVVGSSLEILIFAYGLTYKLQLEYKERMQFQKDSFVNQSRALRAQMNPHFIFNSLSSIQYLISNEQKESAIKYLNKFSALMRNLLEGSIESNNLLANEISLLEKYLELESLRFDSSFNYKIIIDENIDTSAIEIPTLILQPFVENAILHGLLNRSQADKLLLLSFALEDSYLVCKIEDNGIGREAAEEMKSALVGSKKSRGIEVTEKRLQMLNKHQNNHFQIIDKKDNKGNSLGTLVIIKIYIE